jgi:hypothetical protein
MKLKLATSLIVIGFALLCGSAAAQCTPGPNCSPNIGLNEPPYGTANWNTLFNENWSLLDQLLSGGVALTLTSGGIFTGATYQSYMSSLLGGISPAAELAATCIGCAPSVEAITGGVTEPSGTLALGSFAVAAYAVSNADSRIGGTGPPGQRANVTGFFGHVRCVVTGSACWGMNPLVLDTVGTIHTSSIGLEIDQGAYGTPDVYTGVQLFSALGPSGTYPTNAAAIGINAQVGSGASVESPLPNGVYIGQNSATNALQALPACHHTGSETCGSPNIRLVGANGGAEEQGLLFVNSGGQIQLNSGNAANEDVVASGLLVNNGVYQDGSGLKHLHSAAGCATAASAGAACTTTVTWTTAFADANYTVSCTGDGITSGVPLNGGITSHLAASVTFQTVAATAAAAQYGVIDCIAVHPN